MFAKSVAAKLKSIDCWQYQMDWRKQTPGVVRTPVFAFYGLVQSVLSLWLCLSFTSVLLVLLLFCLWCQFDKRFWLDVLRKYVTYFRFYVPGML